MASLLFAGGLLAYEKIKDVKAKKQARKAHNQSRYSDLQSATCVCTSLEKDGEGCPVHDLRRKRLEGEEGDGEEEREGEKVDEGVGRGKAEEAPPRYEDVAAASAAAPNGVNGRIRGKGKEEDGVVR